MSDKPETNDAHAYRRGELEALVYLDPIGKKFRQAHTFAKARGHSFAAEAAENYPCFQGAKSAAKLDAVIHVILLRFDRVAAQIFRHECEDAPQALEIAHVKDTEIQRNEKGFVRIYNNRIGFAPTSSERFVFRQNGEASAIRAVDVQPHLVFAADFRDLGNGIDARR